ncbi:MAG: bifunctional histidinol-phosphatase/imidazoleglycerol-phosphate dehydratase HisB [Gammaproteobacteria bacterium]|jgi:imidazoleglycerol-phosphate dehydratase/histidinol-phosphatase|nr:bifunctional histidinol-phosphatase/imidazoleglycerol-phosphate dehydratase HisB [Gammaproteobacteria bacterium]NCW21366.1 bifunctional histidinol-phosphatase/imidazoleglycerol-phosphate dehydratase HisB [Gammaproteobacteria bacterium]NCW56674.1 bifunctional histidinol-phosphatase/imidazoleglycerol-phosphate dehydratase HisB [Gammaproteobacteria bacterium]NDA43320.1 bifunctional histidinol-phosphatase/imidazoleglycerol-phosphate dehydratase HisB [Gammaproteobacteria bacterium]NDB16355.1 bifu
MKVVFLDRDGTLVEEPPDEQVDRLEKIRFFPGVFAALAKLQAAGYRLAMVTNQDGLGTDSFPLSDFERTQQFIVDSFASQGIVFDEIFVCPHRKNDGCDCRKPKTSLVDRWVAERKIDLAASAMVGDRDTDLQFGRNLGVQAFKLSLTGTPAETWPAIVASIVARRALIERVTRETAIKVSVDLDSEGPVHAQTGIGFFDHMLEQIAKHGGFALRLECQGDLQVDEHHTVEDCALALGEALRKALGDKRGIGRYGFLLPMDEARAQVAIDLSGRSYTVFEGKFSRDQVGGLPTELVPHFFRSLADSLGAAIHVSVTGDNTHHQVESCFKAVGRALRVALRREGEELPSTKGVL